MDAVEFAEATISKKREIVAAINKIVGKMTDGVIKIKEMTGESKVVASCSSNGVMIRVYLVGDTLKATAERFSVGIPYNKPVNTEWGLGTWVLEDTASMLSTMTEMDIHYYLDYSN